ncbi:hypothetical protein EFP14_03680 [Lactiplantibacillus pentosus]|nr:hypothetical protein [Lactiplantibacillus pentosus]
MDINLALVRTSLTVDYQNDSVSKDQRLIQQKVEFAHVCLSNTIPAGRYSGQGQVISACEVQTGWD